MADHDILVPPPYVHNVETGTTINELLYHMTRNHTQACHSISQPEPLFHSEGVSKLYLFSSNKPSSIALISVEKKCHVVSWDRKQVRADQFIREKRTERNVRRVESAQGKIPYSALSIVIFFPSKKRKGLTYHAPKTWKPYITPCTVYLTLSVQTPDWLETGASLWSEYFAHRISPFSKAAYMCRKPSAPHGHHGK